MEEQRYVIAWIAFGAYVVMTAGLALYGMRKTKDLKGFALGNGDMGPFIVGITLAASIASTATFVINPGFVWHDGVSALIHFGLAGSGGVTTGLIVMSKGFRRLGKETKALTLPQWVGARYGHSWMRTYFALLNLVLAITFVVLIIKGSALVMTVTLDLSYSTAVIMIVLFVFNYILLGGTYAHAFIGALQGSMMVLVALSLVGSGLYLFADGGVAGFLDRLAEQDPNLVKPLNPESTLFATPFETFVAPFIISFGLVCQPHILMKSLYLRSDKDLTKYLIVAAVIGSVFASILLTGLYARVAFPEFAAEGMRQDAVIPTYIGHAFSAVPSVLISIALLAAGLSTMDGLLVSASTIAGSDLFLGVLGHIIAPNKTEEERGVLALRASRAILVVMGVVSLTIALDPPALVGLFAMAGIYGLVAASLGPVSFGIFFKKIDPNLAFLAAVVGPAVHFTHYLGVTSQGGTINPSVTAAEGVAACLVIMVAAVLKGRSAPDPAPESPAAEPASAA